MFDEWINKLKKFFNIKEPEVLSPRGDPKKIQIPPPTRQINEEKMQPYKGMMARAQEEPTATPTETKLQMAERAKRVYGEMGKERPENWDQAYGDVLSWPTPTVTPTPTTFTPTQVPTQGRSDKFKAISKSYPENYQNLLNLLNESDANDIEKQLALDVAAQESMFDPIRKASEHGFPHSTSSGLFQFNNGTWKDYLDVNPEARERGANKDNPQDALEAFLWTIRKGIKKIGLSRWDASRDIWGPGYNDEELEVFYQ